MTGTRLTTAELRQFHAVAGRAPLHLQVDTGTQVVRDFSSLLGWLDRYVTVVDREFAKLSVTDMDRARAVTVLRGLRQDLANAADTLSDLDAAIDDGTIEVSATRLTAAGERA